MLEAVLRREQATVVAMLVAITVATWTYILRLAVAMPMNRMMMPRDWTVHEALFMFVMWSAMMVAMMVPSASPMVLIYARVAQQAQKQGKPFAATAWFVGGYLAAWIGFSGLATAAQWGLESLALLTPMMASASPYFGGAVLIVAGLYQWTPLKERCLANCQAPFVFIQRHGGFRRDPQGAWLLGLRHGLYCLGCCWALMALLFVGGVMNVLWIAALTLFVLIEKALATGRWVSRVSGVGFVAAGLWLMTQ
ncbi:MAG: DUF2182 domain-containing protein [Rhodospirillales bacterium]|nr:DUF2182 domain-containing protein [Rhodospirillales bacterium]